MTQTTTSPPNSTIISTLPHKDTSQNKDRLLCIQDDGTLRQLLASSLASQGVKGDPGKPGMTGENGMDGKDSTAPPLAIFLYYDDTPPTGYLFLYGQVFDPQEYPILAEKFPNNILPDFRNRVARGAGNLIQLGEIQEDALQNITGQVSGLLGYHGKGGSAGAGSSNVTVSGAFKLEKDIGYGFPGAFQWATDEGQNYGTTQIIDIDSSLVVRTATETRVKSIGVNFIIKAA